MDRFMSGKWTDRYSTPAEKEKDMAVFFDQVSDIKQNKIPQLQHDLDGKVDKPQFDEFAYKTVSKLDRMELEINELDRKLFFLLFVICTNIFVRFLNWFGHWYVIDFHGNMNGEVCTIRVPVDKEDFKNCWSFYNSEKGKHAMFTYKARYNPPHFSMPTGL